MFNGRYQTDGAGRLVLTQHAVKMKDRRDVNKAQNVSWQHTAQDKAEEKHLSRSKPYPNKTTVPGSVRRRAARIKAFLEYSKQFDTAEA